MEYVVLAVFDLIVPFLVGVWAGFRQRWLAVIASVLAVVIGIMLLPYVIFSLPPGPWTEWLGFLGLTILALFFAGLPFWATAMLLGFAAGRIYWRTKKQRINALEGRSA